LHGAIQSTRLTLLGRVWAADLSSFVFDDGKYGGRVFGGNQWFLILLMPLPWAWQELFSKLVPEDEPILASVGGTRRTK